MHTMPETTSIFSGVAPVLKIGETTPDQMLYYGDRGRVTYAIIPEGSPVNILEWPGFRKFIMESRAAPLTVVDVRGNAPLVNVKEMEIDFEFRGTLPMRAAELWPDPWPVRYQGEGFRLDRTILSVYGQEPFPRSSFRSLFESAVSAPGEVVEEIGNAVELGLEYTGRAVGTVVEGAAGTVSGGTKLVLSLLFVAVLAVAVWAISENLFD